MRARASERLHGPRIRSEYIMAKILHCLSYFFDRLTLYLSQPMPPKAFPGDLSWDLASLVSAWIVGPLYGMCIPHTSSAIYTVLIGSSFVAIMNRDQVRVISLGSFVLRSLTSASHSICAYILCARVLYMKGLRGVNL